jgi:Shedu protein SduA, C-terminal
MRIVRKTQRGIDYLATVLREKQSVVSRAVFWRVPHNSGTETLCLKIGRYGRNGFEPEQLLVKDPKSELTLDDEELRNLLQFLAENYEPLRAGANKYISIDETIDLENVEQVRAIFRNPNKERLLRFIVDNHILPEDLVVDIQHQQRLKAIQEFEALLNADAREHEWQHWFASNSWVLGTDFVRILEERTIDPENVADYLVQAYDGFLGIVEIKRPGGGLRFWAHAPDHGNYVPSSDLVKALTQASRYIFEVEREINSQKFFERIGEVRTVKPRCVLLYGRSNTWDEEQRRAYRILNASYHNLSIMTYDHVLARAKRMLGIAEVSSLAEDQVSADEEIPF